MIQFTVLGRPQPQGSTRMFPIKTPDGPRMVLTSANRRLKPWRKAIYDASLLQALKTPKDCWKTCPIWVSVTFYFASPRKMPKERTGMTTKPDIDKLVRAILDGITGTLIGDDSQVTEVTAVKLYGTPERAEITVTHVVPPL